MDDSSVSDQRGIIMDRKTVLKASEEISDLLKGAFEKHKAVSRGEFELFFQRGITFL